LFLMWDETLKGLCEIFQGLSFDFYEYFIKIL
jgi:hypothetical protein